VISKSFSEDDPDYSTIMNGTGPYKQDEFEWNIRYRLAANEDYWKEGLPYLDSIEQRAIRDDTARMAAIEAGDVDLTSYVTWSSIDDLQSNPDFNVFVRFGTYNCVRLNHTVKPLDDQRVRQALSFALDRDAINSVAFG